MYNDEYMCVIDFGEVSLYEASKYYTFKYNGTVYKPFCDYPSIYLRINDSICY